MVNIYAGLRWWARWQMIFWRAVQVVHSVPISKNCSVFLPFDWQGERNRENPRGAQYMSSSYLLCYGVAGNNVRSDIVLETNLSCWEQIDPIWSRIFSPGPYINFLFRWGRSGTNSDVLVSFLLDVRMFVERLFLYCFDVYVVLL